ncbi:hypothetical protein Ddye_008905 [Dipteronia dyeriana]|uniref:Uncharacterized protein n=1 Tax=Dipteronia dyeriana TaxID=168575 RepID=A0AAD9XBB8_9ROSI|nr:hypothetical protein Ddye_008905 [Dipteronia dyeriana]
MATISHSCGNDQVKDRVAAFVHQSLSKSAYILTYRGMIHLIPDQKIWLEIEVKKILPPPFQTQPSRPKLQRNREPNEKSRGGKSENVVCKFCGMVEHNKRTCKITNSIVEASTSQSPT